MQVVILAGGRGTRLRPYTVSFPKSLVPVGDRPILDIVLRQLKQAGATEIILSTGYLAELIQAYCGDGSRWNLRLRYVREEKPLNTAGPLNLIDGLEENFLVINGDILTTMDFRKLWEHHLQSKSIATIGICERKLNVEFGVLDIGPDGVLQHYTEKPAFSYQVSMGVNALQRRCKEFIQPNEALSMPDLFTRMIAKGEKILCYQNKGRWLDIGRPDDYQLAQDEFENAPGTYLPDADR